MKKYKVIIAGSREHNFTPGEIELLITETLTEFGLTKLDRNTESLEIVSGGAMGIDKAGELFAHKWSLGLKRFLPNWDKYGKSAGYLRNKEMALYANSKGRGYLIAFQTHGSKGTGHMINIATELGLKTKVYAR